jgi:hypothetical protein
VSRETFVLQPPEVFELEGPGVSHLIIKIRTIQRYQADESCELTFRRGNTQPKVIWENQLLVFSGDIKSPLSTMGAGLGCKNPMMTG